MDDLISRQAAIKALIRKRQPVNNGDGTITITMLADEVIRDVLNELPSVQPEIIRCKDCKHRPTATRAEENIYYGFSVEFPDEQCPCHCGDEKNIMHYQKMGIVICGRNGTLRMTIIQKGGKND